MNVILIIVGLISTVYGKSLDSDDEMVCEMSESFGDPEVEKRIIGGSVAVNHSRPCMIYLFSNPQGCTCGGALIAAQWVLTAAHCVDGGLTYTAVAGTNQRRVVKQGKVISGFGPDAELRNATSVHLKEWSSSTRKNDIALLKLDSPFTINNNIKTISLASQEYKKGDILEMSGWGRTSATAKDKSVLLMTVSLPVVSTEDCQQSFPTLFDGQMCAGYINGVNGACKGDSGGPLVKLNEDSITLVGIFSYGKKNCNNYGVYTKVSSFATWITEEMKK